MKPVTHESVKRAHPAGSTSLGCQSGCSFILHALLPSSFQTFMLFDTLCLFLRKSGKILKYLICSLSVITHNKAQMRCKIENNLHRMMELANIQEPVKVVF